MKPGEDLIQQGLRDLAAGEETVPALLVAIGAPRLRRLGLSVPKDLPASPEHRLYHILSELDPDSAHSRYNAWIRRLVSFERAAECEKKQTQRKFSFLCENWARASGWDDVPILLVSRRRC